MIKLFMSLIIIIFLIQVSVAQGYKSDKNSVKNVVIHFNKTLFIEMNTTKAFRLYFDAGKLDATDVKFGLTPNFIQESSWRIDDKTRISAMDFFWNENNYGGVFFLIWWLGSNKLSDKTKLSEIESKISTDENLGSLWSKEVNKLKKERNKYPDHLTPKTIRDFEYITERITSVIIPNIDKELLTQNIKAANNNMSITKQIVDGRDYFTISNNFFKYILTIKKGLPKIISIQVNR